ncbi:Alpha/beta hydrolase [Rhodopseudomonas palustris HaA2]|uniref:Alpha/beta hydrolase n=1 Tax=Rhodopseudomonas palustris (strain HaA2) TaxID=316058 RepID=Q2IWR3_RHOP2|nr:alpha/beta fold hydrolase [Rhodopseudomonas palustris]ABD07347.1 Alpha/beta hydrolase [Rhodopseudomonas palustris HaA2]
MVTPIRSRTLEANGLGFAIDEAGEGDTTALLLHGFPEARQSWHRQLPALAALGWHAVAPDLRGYGGTTRPRAQAAYHLDHLTDDVAALFAALGGKRRILIGHDWGGVIAWQAALRGKLPLDALIILNAPHPDVFARVLADGWRQKRKSWYVALFQLPWLPEWLMTRNDGAALAQMFRKHSPTISDAQIEIYRRNAIQPGAAIAMINYYRANFTALGGGAGTHPKLTVPTLMIWGEDDLALDIALTEGNEAHVADFTLRRLPGASHWVQQDAPDQVNALIADWARGKGLA